MFAESLHLILSESLIGCALIRFLDWREALVVHAKESYNEDRKENSACKSSGGY
jgi:hypothetical protein